MDTLRIDAEHAQQVLVSVLCRYGFEEQRAQSCARLFVETSLDGVASHGLKRFPLFVGMISKGLVDPARVPERIDTAGSFEAWDGQLGPGNLNARACMGRAIEMARESGMGAVALRNTNHWMRGGSYGLQAARNGCIGICMTNTLPNMPPWGGRTPVVGNNPLVIAVPHEPYPILLDMAMSQFSYGKMEVLAARGERLPVEGGLDGDGHPTRDPAAILESELPLPMGYWKGSGLAILIDLLVATLSGGQTTSEIGRQDAEYGISQFFMAFDLQHLSSPDERQRVISEVTASLLDTTPTGEGGKPRYPGQQTWLRRQENERLGVPVEREVWTQILQLDGQAGRKLQ